MNNRIDAYIRRSLKGWAAHQKPPSNVRSQLMIRASIEASQKEQLDSMEALDESRSSADVLPISGQHSGRQISQPRWVFLYMTMSPLSLAAY